jgi:hypothetical protein
MRKSFFLRSAVLFLAAMSPAVVNAQFQPPAPEELKMTADPKAPGTDAVYLDIEEIANDPMHYQSYSARIKVLTEKGRELATVNLPYLKGRWKISDIEGRTIHPDGTVVPLLVKPEDLLLAKSGEMEVGQKVFTLPSVEVGSILEYRYDIHYDEDMFSSPRWEIQRHYFIHKSHYSYTPFKAFMPEGTPGRDTAISLIDSRGRTINRLLWWYKLPPGVTVKTSMNGSYTVDVTDVPAIPDEDWMPPLNSVVYKLQFYYMAATDTKQFWIAESKLWSKDVDKFADPSKAIQAAVTAIVAPGDGDLDKAKKLYTAVQAVDNTNYSRKKTESEMKQLKIKEAKHAEDTWAQRSGDSEDIAMLYLAMARAAGLEAYAVKVVDRDRAVFDNTYLDLNQLNTTVVALEIGGKEIFVDPGEKMCQFGKLSWRHSYATGIGESAQGMVATTTPMQQYTDNAITRNGDFVLDAHGGITGSVNIVMTGQAALRWRQAALRNDDEEVKKQFDRDLETVTPDGVEAHIDHFTEMDQPEANLIAIVKVKGSLGTSTAKRLLLPGFFFEDRRTPFVSEDKRQEPVDMHYGDRVTNIVTYHLPDGVTVEGAPQDADISWPGHAMYVVKSKANGNRISIANSLMRAFTIVKPEEYQDLRGFYQKVSAADQAQLVLAAAPAAAATPAPAAPANPPVMVTVAPAGKGN